LKQESTESGEELIASKFTKVFDLQPPPIISY